MKKRKNIFLKMFLLIVLFFFPRINTHASLDPQRYFIEISNDTDNIESRLTPDNASEVKEAISDGVFISSIDGIQPNGTLRIKP